MNVVIIFTFGDLLTFTHNVYILLGGLTALSKHRGRHGPCPGHLTRQPHVNCTEDTNNIISSVIVIHQLKSMERSTSVLVLTGTYLDANL